MRTEVKIGLLVCVIAVGFVAGYLMLFTGSEDVASDSAESTTVAPSTVATETDPPIMPTVAVRPVRRDEAVDTETPPAPPRWVAEEDPAGPIAANRPLTIEQPVPSALPEPEADPPRPTGDLRLTRAEPEPPPVVTTSERTPRIELGSSPSQRTRTYIVEAGDNGLWAIARKVYGEGRYWYLISGANPTVNTHRLRPGMRLTIPPIEGDMTASQRVATAAAAPARRSDGGIVHVVVEGDTCWGLAERYLGDGSRMAMIAEANPGVDTNRLRIGQRLVIPARPTAVSGRSGGAQATVSADQTVYTIVANDRLETIAKRHYGDAALWPAIQRANPDLDPSRLPIGRQIILPSKATAERQLGRTTRADTSGVDRSARASADAGRAGYVPGKPWFGD